MGAQLFSDSPDFLVSSDSRLASVSDNPMSAPASHDGMASSSDIRSSPRVTKSSLTDSPSARRRQQLGSGMPDMAPRSFSRDTRDNTLLSSSGPSHDHSLGGLSKRSLNEVKESTSESEMDSRSEPLFNPRPPGSSGLPSLLSFTTTSPTRRPLHDDEMSLFKK